MNRRGFLERMALSASGLMFSDALSRPTWAGGHFGRTAGEVDAIAVVTDSPGEAIDLIQQWASDATPRARYRFRETPISGRRPADVTWVRGGRLSNPWTSDDAIGGSFRRIARDLGLPRVIENGALIGFERVDRSPGEVEAWVVHRGRLLTRAPLRGESQLVHVPGIDGTLTCAIGSGSAAIIAAPCRHQTCVKMGPIAEPGQFAVCVPEQLCVVIRGSAPGVVDVIAG